MSSILGIVPARGGSKGVPKKNLRMLGDKPLISWTFDQINKCKDVFSQIILSTDDTEIANIAHEHDISVPFLRPKHLASDSSKMIDVVIHSIEHFKKLNVNFDAILLLQPTVPFRSSKDIKSAIDLFETKKTDSVISVVRTMSHHPNLMKKISKNGFLTPFYEAEIEGTRRQDYKPEAYLRNGAIYIASSDVILKQHSLWGKTITPYVMPEERSINIDSALDFKICETMLDSY